MAPHKAVKKLTLASLVFLTLALLGPASLAMANSAFVGAPVITPLDPTNPWCPGGLVQITLTISNSSGSDEQGRLGLVLSTTAWGSYGALPGGTNANTWYYGVYNGTLGTVGAPLLGSNNSNDPGGGLNVLNPANAYHMSSRTVTLTLRLPATLAYGQNYYFHFATAPYYQQPNSIDGQGGTSPSQLITACTPSGGSSFVGKRSEGTANNGEIMLYWLDYDFIASTNNQVRDTIPACMTILSAQPQPFNGAAASITGQTVQWRVADATSASTPVAYREKGALWVLVSLNGCVGSVCNTGEFTSNFFGGAWQNTNQVCQSIGGVNVALYKRQYDSTYTPITSANDGQTVNYVLNYTLSGSGLRCFDSFNSYTPGTYPASGLPAATGGKWSRDPDSNGSDQWSINSLPNGERYIQYQCSTCGQYRILRYDCPQARTNTEDICGNVMVEVDVRIDGSFVNGDTGIVIRNNNRTAGSTARGYMVILSVDSQGGGNVQNLQLQRNVDPFNSGTAWPTAGGYTAPAGQAPRQGVWYTIKAIEQPAGYFRIKFWERGTPEPAWQITFDDSAYMNSNQLACGNAGSSVGTGIGDGWNWQPGIAGQADYMSYDNFRVYGAAYLDNPKIWDTIPAGVDYTGTLNTPLAQAPSGSGANEGMIRWDFAPNNFGAVGGRIYEGSGSFTWSGVVDCSEAGIVNNTAMIGADPPASNQSSNTTNLTIASCGTPTSTRTPTSTVTPTPTRTATPTYTSTYTPTATRTPSPTQTNTYTYTSTSTYTSTRTDTPTVTFTNTPSPTFTETRSPTWTPTATPSWTFTDTRTSTSTRTDTPTVTFTSTHTPTITVTVPYTSTNTPTVTPSWSPSDTRTSTSTSTDTPTPTPSRTSTPSATESITFTHSPTLTATRTVTLTATQTVTFTSTYTRTDTPTVTLTYTPTYTRTVTYTFTVSPTITETPIPSPFKVVIGAYNSAGELVKIIFNGSAQYQPGDLGLNKDLIPGGAPGADGAVSISFPGYLMDPKLGKLSSVLWLADNNDGQLIDGGVYTIKAEIQDNFGQVTSLQRSIQVVSVRPQNELVIFNSAGEVVAKPQLVLGPTKRSLTSVWLKTETYAPTFNPDGSTVAGLRFYFRDETGVEVWTDWDGKNALGVPVASGSYTAQLLYNAGGGGGTKIVQQHGFVVIQAGNIANFDGAYAVPNPALRGAPIKISYPVTQNYSAAARMFSLSGELIAAADDPLKSGWMVFDSGRMAPGVYIIKLEKLSGGALVTSRILKVAVVR